MPSPLPWPSCSWLITFVFHQKMPCKAHAHLPLAGSSTYLCWAAAGLQEKAEGLTQQVNKRWLCEDQSTAFIYFFLLCSTNALVTGTGPPASPSPSKATFPHDRAPCRTAGATVQVPSVPSKQQILATFLRDLKAHKWSYTSILQHSGVPKYVFF